MSTTLIIEPNPSGHRFQAVANVAAVVERTHRPVLLTSQASATSTEFEVYLAATGIEVREVFASTLPGAVEIAEAVAARCRTDDVAEVVVMDADQLLKRWWYLGPRALRGLSRRPRIVFMLTRYPAKLRLSDRVGWGLRLPKATLAVAAMATGSLHRAAGFAGRDDMSRGWIVRRTRDPDVCSAHARDRASLREALGLPQNRTLVGIFGVITERKNAPLIWRALEEAGIEADLVLAGKISPEVATWAATCSGTGRGRILVRDGFLPNEELDQLVAAADVVPIALTNNGPSGIMGKALAAGVPVVTAGSEVRARELVATDAGELAELDATSIGAAIGRALARDPDAPRRNRVPPATAEEFAINLLGGAHAR